MTTPHRHATKAPEMTPMAAMIHCQGSHPEMVDLAATPETVQMHRTVHALIDAGQWPPMVAPTPREQAIAAIHERMAVAQAELDRLTAPPMFASTSGMIEFPESLRATIESLSKWISLGCDVDVQSGWDDAGLWKITATIVPRPAAPREDHP